jgi:hypothetical protein
VLYLVVRAMLGVGMGVSVVLSLSCKLAVFVWAPQIISPASPSAHDMDAYACSTATHSSAQ